MEGVPRGPVLGPDPPSFVGAANFHQLETPKTSNAVA